MSQITKGKNRNPQGVGYNALFPIVLPTTVLSASEVNTLVQARAPLGLNVKVMSVSYVLSGSVAGTADLNIVSGAGSYEGTGSAPFGTVTFTGTFAALDTISITIGTNTQSFTVSALSAGNNIKLAAAIAAAFNRAAGLGQGFGTGFYFYSSGNILFCIDLSYGTAGNALAFAAIVVSTSGIATASGATLTGGSGSGPLPTLPALDNSDVTSPPQTAAAGSALFGVDIPLNMAADVPTVLYPVQPKTFDAIWPAGSELTLRLVTNGSATGNLNVILWCVAYDVFSYNPDNYSVNFLPSPFIL